jgi:N-acetylglucosamine kinase-like BadF-type ATPase
MIYLGIDGGGSNLRAVLTDEHLHPLAELKIASTANPSSIGREAAAALLHQAIGGVLSQAGLAAEQVTAVGIGVAGADASHSANWLTQVLRPILPAAHLALSNDIEIALVGAQGARFGVMVVAGTGSAVYGVSRSGMARMFGGWGYLLGDDGGGFWMGREALRLVTDVDDRRGPASDSESALVRGILQAANVPSARDLIPWIYGTQPPRVRDIAALTDVIFAATAAGDHHAAGIVRRAAKALCVLVHAAERQLHIPHGNVAFGGGLLQSPTPLQAEVCRLLRLSAPPTPRYTAVMGAALLAQLSATSSVPSS